MPMLSFSHRTTAPAMATEPWDKQQTTMSSRSVEILVVPMKTVSHPPPGRSRQAGPFPTCRPLWSVAHVLTGRATESRRQTSPLL